MGPVKILYIFHIYVFVYLYHCSLAQSKNYKNAHVVDMSIKIDHFCMNVEVFVINDLSVN